MKTVLWVDDLRDPPNRADERYVIARSVNEAKRLIEELDQDNWMDCEPYTQKKWHGAYSVPLELKLVKHLKMVYLL